MKAVVAAFNQEKALVGAFSVITNLRMELFEALACTSSVTAADMQYRKVNRFTAAKRGCQCQWITLRQTQEEALHF